MGGEQAPWVPVPDCEAHLRRQGRDFGSSMMFSTKSRNDSNQEVEELGTSSLVMQGQGLSSDIINKLQQLL